MEIFIIIWFVLLGNAADQVYGPGVVAPIECVGVACDNDRGDKPAMEPAMRDVPDVPDVPDAPGDKPDDKSDKGDRDRGHGNDDDRDDEDNPGKGKHKGRNK